LLFSRRGVEWILLVFPLWVLMVSVYILGGNLREPPQTSAPVLEEEKKHD